MAILRDILCTACGQNKEVLCSTNCYPSICKECEKMQKSDARSRHLAGRLGMSVEERLALLEAEAYDRAHAPRAFDIHSPIG